MDSGAWATAAEEACFIRAMVKEAVEAMRVVMRAKPRALAAGRGVELGDSGAVIHVTALTFAAVMPSDSGDAQATINQCLKNLFSAHNAGMASRAEREETPAANIAPQGRDGGVSPALPVCARAERRWRGKERGIS